MAELIKSESIPLGWLHPSQDGSDLAVDEFPAVMLVGTTTLIQRHLTRPALEPFGFGIPEWRLMAYLHLRPGSWLGDIDKEMWMDKAQISRTLESLVRRNLAQRRPDPAHLSRQLIALTALGRSVYMEALQAIRQTQADMLLALGGAERAALFSALAKLRSVAKNRAPVEEKLRKAAPRKRQRPAPGQG